MNYNYITKEEVSVTYFQFPKFLLKYPISQNGKVVYMLLYDRARLSQMNNWLDENLVDFPGQTTCI
ncbi:MAG: replication initiator protein A [[Ruminococcus] lactaris]|uniref:replication initiator protein A n=1 Tax=[Ruminococcus] lactaris TaxID=46228 RepID=UPI0039A04CB5